LYYIEKEEIDLFIKMFRELKREMVGSEIFYVGGGIPELALNPPICYQPWSKFNNNCEYPNIIDSVRTNEILKKDKIMKAKLENNYISFFDEIAGGLAKGDHGARLIGIK